MTVDISDNNPKDLAINPGEIKQNGKTQT